MGLSDFLLYSSVYFCAVSKKKEKMKNAKKVLDKLWSPLYNNHALFEMPV